MKTPVALFAACMALLSVATAAPADAQDNSRVMKALEFGELRAIAADLDYLVTGEGVDQDGDYYLDVETDSGLPFTAYGVICDEDDPTKDCIGLNLVTTFSLEAGKDVQAAVDTVQNAFIKVYKSGEDLRIARYVIFDEGITRGNLQANVEVFVDIADMVWEQLSEDDWLED